MTTDQQYSYSKNKSIIREDSRRIASEKYIEEEGDRLSDFAPVGVFFQLQMYLSKATLVLFHAAHLS